MQAMVFEKPGQPLVLKEVPMPKPAENQALVKINCERAVLKARLF